MSPHLSLMIQTQVRLLRDLRCQDESSPADWCVTMAFTSGSTNSRKVRCSPSALTLILAPLHKAFWLMYETMERDVQR